MRNKPTYQQKPFSLQAKRTDMKAFCEHCGDGKSPIQVWRMAFPLERGTGFSSELLRR